MIVISRDITLAPVVSVDISAPIIGWRNAITRAGVEATSEDPYNPATNLANPSTALWWRSTSTAEQFITFDPGFDAVDYVGLARHNFGSGRIGVTIQGLRGEDEAWTSIIPEFMPADDKPILARFDAQIYFRLRIRLRPTSAVPGLAVLFAGRLIVMPTGEQPGFTPITFGKQTDVVNARAQSGDYLGTIIRQERFSSASNFRYLRHEWVRQNLSDFIAGVRASPFFYAWAPVDYPDQIGFAWATSDIRPSLDAPDFVDIQITYDAVAG